MEHLNGANRAHFVLSTSERHLFTMKGEVRERWMRLCEEAALEQDPEKLMELVSEINRLLEEKEKRLLEKSQMPGKP